jgi:branched-chain amino acid aminotransferase/4-amino-4-deoxychorismate lyase
MSGMAAAVPSDFQPWLGVFETVRVEKGVPLFVSEHLTEFRRAAETMGLSADVDVEKQCGKLPPKSGRWRWIVTATSRAFMFTEEKAATVRPVDLSVSPLRVGSQNWDARFKTLSYLTHVQALKIAGTPDAILLNEHREVASAARANLFWRRGERLFTPAHETGCRRGVVRGFVLGRRAVEEGSFSLDNLLEADEIFLTNSIRGVISVRSVEGRMIESDAAAKSLRREYAAEVRRQVRQAGHRKTLRRPA